MGRFINADSYTSTGQGILGHNMFAYCGNNPIVRCDPSGNTWETFWDIWSLVESAVEVICNPCDPWAWASLILDAADVIIPFVGGLGETVRVVEAGVRAVNRFGNLSRAQEFGVKAYKSLRKLLAGTGLQAHHVIEQRLVKFLGIDVNAMLSVAVTAAEHQQFTNAWRQWFKYGMDYTTLTREAIWKAAQSIYKNYPELLDAAKKILFG